MQNVIARLSRTPGSVRWSGRPLGADTDEIRRELADRDDSRSGRPDRRRR